MKKNQIIGLSFAALTGAFMIQGCDLVKDIEYKANPNPLEYCGDTVRLNINGKFIEKGIHKKAIAECTPVLITSSGKEYAFKTDIYQGPKAVGNGKVIPKEGGSFSYSSSLPFAPDMEVGEVKVKIVVKKGTKVKDEIITDKIADATIITPLLVMGDDKVIFGKDNFVRVTQHTAGMEIHYGKNQSNVRPGELKDQDYKDFYTWIAGAMKNDRINIKSISLPAYASPEGEISLNGNLANERAMSTMKQMLAEAKKMKWEKGMQEGLYQMNGRGEDWEGFKKEVMASDIPDKELIIRVLEMYSDLDKREQEIKNMAKTYKILEDKILPKQRRTTVVLAYDLSGKTDAELVAWSKKSCDSLTAEELFFTANTLVTDMNEKLRLYREACRIYPKDWRGFNNAGYILFMQNKINEAKAEFEKAAALDGSNKIIKNNLGACARITGDYAKAEKLFNEAMGAGDEVSYNLGICNIKKCKYGEAVSQMAKFKTFNTALAQLLNGDGGAATSTLDGSEVKDAAMSHYLRAVIAARSGNMEGVKNSLTNAFAKDGSLKAKAAKDREFIKWLNDPAFQALVK
ncbi:MAG: tetratricopeptide repeat protein [Bacteroidota bacterium]